MVLVGVLVHRDHGIVAERHNVRMEKRPVGLNLLVGHDHMLFSLAQDILERECLTRGRVARVVHVRVPALRDLSTDTTNIRNIAS
jgi:hypothetical protein